MRIDHKEYRFMSSIYIPMMIGGAFGIFSISNLLPK
jgi:hypothetical protein